MDMYLSHFPYKIIYIPGKYAFDVLKDGNRIECLPFI